MNYKKLFTGAFVGALVFFLLGWLIYGNLLLSFMRQHPGLQRHINRKDMDFAFLIAGNFLQGLLLAYIILLGNIRSMVAGLLAGAIVGFLITASIDCVTYGTTVILSKTGMLADVAAATVISAIAGGLIALVTGKSKNY